jgi:hypothetical protein
MIVSILFQRSVTYKCKVFCFCPVLKKLCKKDILKILQKVSCAVFVWDKKERKKKCYKGLLIYFKVISCRPHNVKYNPIKQKIKWLARNS